MLRMIFENLSSMDRYPIVDYISFDNKCPQIVQVMVLIPQLLSQASVLVELGLRVCKVTIGLKFNWILVHTDKLRYLFVHLFAQTPCAHQLYRPLQQYIYWMEILAVQFL